MKWISVEDETPNNGENVRAFGTWHGEINGDGEKTTAEGEWTNGNIMLDSDTYSTWLINVTHWHRLPDPPD